QLPARSTPYVPFGLPLETDIVSSKRLNGSCPDLRLPELFGSRWSQSGSARTYVPASLSGSNSTPIEATKIHTAQLD
ncbi:hypothetical protein JMJ77_0014610, partial [Colletotrichum scovillei]